MQLANGVRATRATSILTAFDNGAGPAVLQIWSGTAPATKGAAPAGTLLAEIALAEPAGVSTSGVLTLTVPRSDTSANAGGTAGFWRVVDGVGAYVCNGTVGVATGELQLVSLTIVAAAPVEVTAFTFTEAD